MAQAQRHACHPHSFCELSGTAVQCKFAIAIRQLADFDFFPSDTNVTPSQCLDRGFLGCEAGGQSLRAKVFPLVGVVQLIRGKQSIFETISEARDRIDDAADLDEIKAHTKWRWMGQHELVVEVTLISHWMGVALPFTISHVYLTVYRRSHP